MDLDQIQIEGLQHLQIEKQKALADMDDEKTLSEEKQEWINGLQKLMQETGSKL